MINSDKYKINTKRKDEIEFYEIFLDRLAKKKEEESNLSEKKIEAPLDIKIIRIVLGCFLFLLLILFFRVSYFQTIKGDVYGQISERNKTRTHLSVPERGIIYDKSLKQLVWNDSSFDLICDKRYLFSSTIQGSEIINKISEIIEKDTEKLKEIIEKSEKSLILVEPNLSHQKLILIEANLEKLTGCNLEESFSRKYIESPSIFQFLGYTRRINEKEFAEKENYSINDYIGKSGIEKYYEDVLRGTPGIVRYEKDALGEKRGEETLTDSQPGKSLILHLDIDLQTKISESLEKNMERIGAQKAAAVAINPQNGGVLAMNSIPTVDNNFFNQLLTQEKWEEIKANGFNLLLNRAISGEYLTGSTIKPLIGLAALEEGIISAKKSLFAPLELCLLNRYSGLRECFRDWEFHGWTDMRRAIAESVNPYFYIIGGGYTRPGFADQRLPNSFQGLGDEKIKKWLNIFNWGEKTEIDLPSEIAGRVPDSEWKKNYFSNPSNQIWTIGDNYNLSIGQGDIRITPLQVATSFTAIANGSTIYQPQIVDKIIKNSSSLNYVTSTENLKNEIKNIEPKIIKENFADTENIEVIREGMRQAVTSGSARLLNDLPVKVAAKTGTAQIPKEGHFHHWLVLFAPYENPEIVLVFLVEEVEGLQSITLPVAKEVLSWYFK